MKKITLLAILLIVAVCAGQAFAGPAVNAQQFQQKAVRQAFAPAISAQGQAPSIENVAGDAGDAAKSALAEGADVAEMIRVPVSREIIDQQMKCYKGDLKEIVKEAEDNLKKIDSEIKSEQNVEAYATRLKSGNELASSGKYLEANAEYQAALAAASTSQEKRAVKDKQRAIAENVSELGKNSAKQQTSQQNLQQNVQSKSDAIKAQTVDADAVAKAKADAAANAQAVEAARVKAEVQAKAQADAAAAKEKADAQARAQTEADTKAETETKTQADAEITQKAAAPVPVPTPVAPAESSPVDIVSTMYKDAVALYWDNKYAEAQSKFEEVQQSSPGYARTAYYLGRIKEKQAK